MRTSPRLVFGLAIFVAGCSALIGVNDLTYDDRVGPANDGGSSGSADSSGSSGNADGGADASCSMDLMTDGKHCGRCGHDCGGGSCAKGRCEPFELARDQDGPQAIAVDGANVYWANYGGTDIMSVPKSGGAPKSIATITSPTALAYDPTTNKLFYGADSSEGAVRKCTAPDCQAPEAISTGVFVQFIALRDGIVYFTSENQLRRVSMTGTDERPIGGAPQGFHVAVDETHVYWTSNAPQLQRVPHDGGTQEDLGPIDGANNANFVALDKDRFFWTSRPTITNGTIFSAAKTNPPVKRMYAENGRLLTAIAVDETFVYWLEAGTITGTFPNDVPTNDGRLLACKKAGCATGEPLELAKDCKLGGVITQDPAFLYWTEYGGTDLVAGRIRKVAKP